jgi:hypothetical protein
VGQKAKRKAEFLVEVTDFFVLGFQVLVIRVGQNKVQDQEPGADQFVGQTAAIAKIVLLDGLIEGACEEVVDQGMTGESGSPNVAMVGL